MRKTTNNIGKAIAFGGVLPGAALLLGAYALSTGVKAAPVAAPSLRALIVGGGPSSDYNQVSISKNVRYVRRLLPAGTPHITLFATGNLNDATVLEGESRLSPGESMLHLLLSGSDASFGTPHYAKPNLGGRLDGASSPAHLKRAFAQLNRENNAKPLPLLLYFTGHGGPGWNKAKKTEDYENNTYGLWNDEDFTVRDLAKHIAQLPPKVPVTLVMVQCYSGGFGNVLFKDGAPNGPLIERDIVGFFAATKDHTAAGCTSEVNEAEYRDFTSYFFAALCGQDRVGRRLTGADYNGDGRVGMDEAYHYSLGHDVSIDIPTATSDVFLRRFVSATENDILKTEYRQLLAWASPAQKAALGQLSTRLKLTGEDRLLVAYRQLQGENWWSATFRRFSGAKPPKNSGIHSSEDQSEELTQAYRSFYGLWKTERTRFLKRYPALATPRSAAYPKAKKQAIAQLTHEVKAGKWKKLSDSYNKLYEVYTEREKSEVDESLHLRFLKLGKSIVLAHRLESGTDLALKQRFTRLEAAEARSLLPFINKPASQADLKALLRRNAVASAPREANDTSGCGVAAPARQPLKQDDW